MTTNEDHRDSVHDALDLDADRIADDLLLDAILAGRATDRPEAIKERVRNALDAIDTPLARIDGSNRAARRSRWSIMTAAAVLLLSVGLIAVLVATPTPAYAVMQASIDRLESRDLTFQFTVDLDERASDEDKRSRKSGHRRAGIERRLDGAVLHVRGDQAVMLLPGRGGETFARGHRDGRFWSNHLPEHVEAAIAERGGYGGLPFQQFLDLIDGDLPSLLGDLKKGFTLEEGASVVDDLDGSVQRHISGTRIARAKSRGDATPRNEPRRGRVERFDLWIDEDGNLRRLRLDGLRGPSNAPLGSIDLELVGTEPLDDAIFDPASYPEIRRPKPPRGDRRGGPPSPDDRRPRDPRD